EPNWNARRAGILPFLTSNGGLPIAADFQLHRYSGTPLSWAASGPGASQDLSRGAGFVSTMATTEANNGILYTGSSDGVVWYTTDLGVNAANWHRVDNNAFGNARINAISVNPIDGFD